MNKPPDIAFLREIGMAEDALVCLGSGEPMTITGPVLANWLRIAFACGAGMKLARVQTIDPYQWYSPGDIIDMRV